MKNDRARRRHANAGVAQSKSPRCTAKIVEGLTLEQKREFIIKDNGSMGEWNMDILADAWSDLPLADWASIAGRLDVADKEAKEDDFDADAEADKIVKPVTRRGDIWLLGKQRIMCGDSKKKEDVEQADGATAKMFTPERSTLWRQDCGQGDKATGKGQIGSGGKKYSPIIGDKRQKQPKKFIA